MYKKMAEFVSCLSEPQRVALLYMLLGLCFFLGGFIAWLENT